MKRQHDNKCWMGTFCHRCIQFISSFRFDYLQISAHPESATGWTGHRPIRLPLTNGQMWSSFTNHVLQNIPTSPVDFSEWAAEDSARGVLEEWFIGYVASACRDTVAATVRTWYPQPDRLFSDHLVGWGLNAEIWRFLFQVGPMLTCFFYQWELL